MKNLRLSKETLRNLEEQVVFPGPAGLVSCRQSNCAACQDQSSKLC